MTLFAIATTGDEKVLDAAREVGTCLVELLSSYVPTRKKQSQPPAFAKAAEAVTESMRDFVTAAREDLHRKDAVDRTLNQAVRGPLLAYSHPGSLRLASVALYLLE